MLSPTARRAKVDGVIERVKQARMECCRELEKCLELMRVLQSDCPHTATHDTGRAIQCMACDYELTQRPSN